MCSGENAGNVDAGSWEIKFKYTDNQWLSQVETLRRQEEKRLKWQEEKTCKKVKWRS